jgi:gamma-glutamyl-gamma-aminobutyrate hydrolase PuuD
MMKKIFLTPKLLTNKFKKSEISIDREWFEYLYSIDLIGLTGFYKNKFEIINIANHFDGLIVTGGGDINKINKNELSKTRDTFELKLINSFIKKKKPILCICRGFQLYAEYLGGTVFRKNKIHVRKNHFIYREKKSLIFKYRKLNTNSYHNYSILKTNNNIENFYISKDSSIEVAKVKKKKIFFFMFHPERKNKDQKKINIIIKKIFK